MAESRLPLIDAAAVEVGLSGHCCHGGSGEMRKAEMGVECRK